MEASIKGKKLTYPLAVYSFPELGLEICGARDLDEIIDRAFERYAETADEELFEKECPYFCVPWPSGVQLAKLALEQREHWQNKRVIEIACGLALPTLALAKKGLSDLVALDLHPDAPLFFEKNIERLSLASRPHFLLSGWELLPSAHVILAADALYDRRQPEALVEALKRSDTWQEVWVVDPQRGYWEDFLRRVQCEGWNLALGQWEKGQWARIQRP